MFWRHTSFYYVHFRCRHCMGGSNFSLAGHFAKVLYAVCYTLPNDINKPVDERPESW